MQARWIVSCTDRLLSRDAKRRIRVAQTGVAILATLPALIVIQYAAWVRVASSTATSMWTLVTLGGCLVFFVAVRSGWSERFTDPSLTIAQMAYAIASCGAAYAILGTLRGAVFPLVMVVLMFGMFSLTPRKALGVSIYASILFGLAMATQSTFRPEQYPPTVEFGHFLMLSTMMPAVSILAGQLSRLRTRLNMQKHELANALERVEFLATRDDLTGLINRRQVTEMMERERQRSIRTGAGFCIALIDLDHFKRINDDHGHAAGDEVLRAFALEATRIVRATDALGRWGGEEFMLLMPDAVLPSAGLGAERLRLALAKLEIQFGDSVLTITFSAGVVQNGPGETIARTVERADLALYSAKSQGRNQVVVG
jgi:diguanylate cyclase (GGDEF)-like protein